jgi:hypothetical protein
MAPKRWLLPLLILLPCLLAPAGRLLGDSESRIEPFGGIRWNDRIQDAAARMGELADGRQAELSLVFHDRVSPVPFGTRTFPPGNGQALVDAISAISREYLDAMEADRKRGDDRVYRAFHLHVLGMLFEKSGQRKSFLDAEIRVTVRGVMLQGVPFDMTATFQANPGAGLTERYVIPVSGTRHVLPVVLVRVSLASASPSAKKRYPEIDASLRKRYEGFRKCAIGGAEGWCDGRPASVAWSLDGQGAVSILYDAEKYWEKGLAAVYKEHLDTVEGRSKRCHGRRAIDA